MELPELHDQPDLFVDMDMSFWIDESFDLPLTSDTQSTETKSLKSSKKSEETDTCQLVLDVASKRRMYRRRQKGEREALKRQEIELAKELIGLREREMIEKAKLAASRSRTYLYWKDIAMRQLKQRTSTEAEQRRLSTAVRMQFAYINNLRDLLQKRPIDPRSMSMPSKKLRVSSSERAMIDSYLQDLDRNYLMTDDVFRPMEKLDTEAPVYSVQLRESDGEVAFYQKLTWHFQPFPLDITAQTLWELGQRQHTNKQDFVRNYNVEKPDHTIVANFVEQKVSKNGITVPLLQRFIARQFVRDNCIVNTWKFITEGQGIFRGMQMDETGWCRMLPSTDVTNPGTMVEICLRRVPVYFRTSPRGSDVDDFHVMIQDVSDETYTHVMSSIKTRLLLNVPEVILS